MEYQYLNTDEQKAMLEARLRQLEAEHYGHTMNLKNADPDDEATIKTAEEALGVIDRAYGVAQMELALLEEPATKGKKSA